MDPGSRPHFVEFQRATISTDENGGETRTWHEIATGWARLRYGTGQERREAAQQNAVQAITLEFDWSTVIAAVKVTDRAILFDTAWDINSRAIIGQNREVHLTALASLDVEVDS